MTALGANELVITLHYTMVTPVRREGPDLTARQLAVFLICYLDPYSHTVRSLAATLSIPQPAATRTLVRLGDLDLVRRETNPADRRSARVRRTALGAKFLREMHYMMKKAQAGTSTPKGISGCAPAGAVTARPPTWRSARR